MSLTYFYCYVKMKKLPEFRIGNTCKIYYIFENVATSENFNKPK